MRARLLMLLVLLCPVLVACGSDDSDSAASSDCTYTKSAEAAETDAKLPPASPQKATTATIVTNSGEIKATLTPDATPCTVNSFVSLAKQGFFDDTKCHRLVPGFVLQCGDPTATGRGGPGYEFDDELTGQETYPAGTLAMANAGPDTNGSQFFIVLTDVQLNPAYTVFGRVDAAGLKVAQAIEAQGNKEGTEQPAKDVVIEKVSVS